MKTLLTTLFSICLLSGSAAADDSTKNQTKHPYLFWQGNSADSGEWIEGEVTSPDLKMIKTQMEQLDWSSNASGKTSFGISLGNHNYIRIELTAAEKGKKRARVAVLRIPVSKSGNKLGGEIVGYATPYPRSKPLKDSDHVLRLLNSYLKKDNDLESLADWETTGGKLPTPAEEKVAASVPDQEDPLKRDQAAIQGKWKVVAMRAAGNPGPDNVIAVMKYEFKGNRLIITPAEPGTGYTFKLDPSSKPTATLDITPVDSKKPDDTMKGIYVLVGDQLKLCLAKKKRPTEMRAEAKDGFGQMLIELEREKP